ncbi:hypothetical protein ACFWGN_20010 [Oerskovia sp. NPDC060338]|uniref:hypothetical protein n=1 Tax=Oerskovia sp. NPDC060338 TaxID=3347100 RepID=UPI0036579CC9
MLPDDPVSRPDASVPAKGAADDVPAVGATSGKPPRRRSRRVVRRGTEQAGVAGLGSDDDAVTWGDARPGAAESSHDAELLRDVPPHWS